jgi:hypothetical protein
MGAFCRLLVPKAGLGRELYCNETLTPGTNLATPYLQSEESLKLDVRKAQQQALRVEACLGRPANVADPVMRDPKMIAFTWRWNGPENNKWRFALDLVTASPGTEISAERNQSQLTRLLSSPK